MIRLTLYTSLIITSLALSSSASPQAALQDIFEAAASGNTESIQAFFLEGGSPNVRRPGSGTLLLHAVVNKHVQAVKFLLENRANPEYGKEPDPQDRLPISNNITPLEWIEGQKREHAETSEEYKAISDLLQNAFNGMKERNERVLIALKQNDIASVKTELSSGCVEPDVYKECLVAGLKAENLPLVMKLVSLPDFSVTPMTEQLIAGAKHELKKPCLDALIARHNDDVYLAFKYLYHKELTPELLNAGIGRGRLLVNAAANGNFKLVKLLLERGADPNARVDGHTALDLVCSQRDSGLKADIVELLTSRRQ